MDALKAEIARKRKTHDKLRPDTKGKVRSLPLCSQAAELHPRCCCSQKYFRRGDLEAKRKQEYFAQHSAKPAAKTASAAPPPATTAGAAAPASDSSSTNEPAGSDEDTTVAVLEHMVPAEVKRRLRALGEVVTFFGESDDQREGRLKKIQTTLGEEGTEGRLNVVGELLRKQEKELASGLEGAGSLLTEEGEKIPKDKTGGRVATQR
eukprot:COSAG04_NODE_2466_length_4076_cov_22.944933_5_plen_207_part_00